MKISSNLNNFINKISFKNCTQYESIGYNVMQEMVEDTFISSDLKSKNPFRSKKRKFQISDYKALSDEEKEITRQYFCRGVDRNRVQRNVRVAVTFKEYLDKKYGKDNYIFESIGTSPATLGRVLEFMGVETHYLPISDLRCNDKNTIKIKIKENGIGINTYKEFLKSQGIDKKEIKDSKKTYLFYDYTHTGKTLKMFKQILSKYFDISTMSKKIKFRSLNKDLEKVFSRVENNNNNQEDCCTYIQEELTLAKAQERGGVPHLEFFNLGDIETLQNKSSTSCVKKYNFLVMDELNKLGLLKENPANKINKF